MEAAIKLRKLGASDLFLSPIGLGCWQFSRGKGFMGNYWSFVDESEIRQIIQQSLAGGINWFDTAESYGWGESERMLSKALQSLNIPPESIHIADKWSPTFRFATSIGRTIDERLRSLAPYPISLYQIHHPFSFSSIPAQITAMIRLLEQGKIRYVGVSNFSARQMRKAHQELKKYGYALVSNQVHYSLIHRRIETNGILNTARELGVAIISYSPLEQGILTGKFHRDPQLLKKDTGYRKYRPAFQKKSLAKCEPVIRLLEQFARSYQVTPAQVALNWLIHSEGELIFAIPGATRVNQVKDLVGSMRFTLSIEDRQKLDDISRPFR